MHLRLTPTVSAEDSQFELLNSNTEPVSVGRCNIQLLLGASLSYVVECERGLQLRLTRTISLERSQVEFFNNNNSIRASWTL